MPILSEINKAIAAHGFWKQHLREAIATGRSQFTVEQVRSDHACDFGKWLQTLPPAIQHSPQCQHIRTLHTQFHQDAARVLQLALTGHKLEAEQAMQLGGHFAKTSAALTIAMTEWRATFE